MSNLLKELSYEYHLGGIWRFGDCVLVIAFMNYGINIIVMHTGVLPSDIHNSTFLTTLMFMLATSKCLVNITPDVLYIQG